jgi:hypothetical protein
MRAGALALPLLAAPALAVDGVREINHTCATTTGCFTGDTMGYPVTITVPGSYRLTSNLTLADAYTDGIVVATADVGIDLNGFAITGVTNCSTTGIPTCSNTGTGRGIASSGPFVRGLSVRNGTVAKMGSVGIFVGEAGEVRGVHAIGNGSLVIVAQTKARILGCIVERNGGGGINVGTAALVADNVMAHIGGTEPGIDVLDGIVRGNVIDTTESGGIRSQSHSLIADNTLISIFGEGISAGTWSTISGNTVGSSGDGIVAEDGSTISGNTISVASGDGIVAEDGARISGNNISISGGGGNAIFMFSGGYADNVITHDPAGLGVVGGINLGDNVCDGIPCP